MIGAVLHVAYVMLIVIMGLVGFFIAGLPLGIKRSDGWRQ